MRICLDISAALGQDAGIGRYARELAIALSQLPDGPELLLFHNQQSLSRLPASLASLPCLRIPLSNRTWRLFLWAGLPLPGGWTAPLQQCQLFHGTDSLAPRTMLPTVLTIHDLSPLLFPEHHTRFHRLYSRYALPGMARRAQVIITDSAATQSDVISRLHIASDRTRVIHLGLDHKRFYPRDPAQAQMSIQQALGIRPPYLLAIGTLEPRKNLLALLRAYAQLEPDSPMLVLAGKQGWGNTPLTETAQQLGIQDRVSFTGFVPDALLPDLYAGAHLFVYPSLYEGFGLPVLEALGCGTPVITSKLSSLPEVAGDAALLVDPYDIDDLAQQMRNMLFNSDLRAHLRSAGPKQAAQFTWQRTAQQTLAVYRDALHS
jgi:glycosyltransferase involved in cell wall biosynthesis